MWLWLSWSGCGGGLSETVIPPEIPGDLEGQILPPGGSADVRAVAPRGHPPEIAAVVLSPEAPLSGEALSCVPTGVVDRDGDRIAIDFAWFVDDVAAGVGPVLAPGPRAGQQVACTATPRDVYGPGAARRSSTVILGNSLPRGMTVAVTPATAVSGRDDLVCAVTTVATDLDGDPVTTEVAWHADGAPWGGPTSTTTWPGDTVSAWDTTRAREWTCEVTAIDLDLGTQVVEASLSPVVAASNVLVLLADDLGNDKVGAYGEHPSPPPTPRIDALAADGVLFRNFYTSPSCSPTRATLMTGRRTRRYGIGTPIHADEDPIGLPTEELILPEMLGHAPTPYTTALAGKWHLSSFASGPEALLLQQEGFDWHAGSVENLHRAQDMGGALNYFRWEKNVQGDLTPMRTYATADTVDDAVSQMATMSEPWMLWVSFNAPHWPFHVPEEPRLTQTIDEDSPNRDKADAMIESLDFAVGDVLDGMAPDLRSRTMVLFLGDNGTDMVAIAPPWNPFGAKGTIHEGGVNTPLIVQGPLVTQPGTECDALVASVDVYDTIAAIAGVDLVEVDAVEGVVARDGQSLLPYVGDPDRPGARSVVYTDKHLPVGPPPYNVYDRAVFDGRFKLHRYENRIRQWEELYDLATDEIEGVPLLMAALDQEAREAYARLSEAMDAIEVDLEYEY